MVSEKLIRQLFRTQDQAVIRRLSEISETVIYKKRQEIHKAGETYTHFYMLLRGAVYTYFYDEHQHPVVLCFFSEKNDFMNVENFNKQSTVGMTALTETEVFRVPIKEILQLSDEIPTLIWVYAGYLQKIMMYLCVINNRRMNLTAEERYQWFCEKWPEVEASASNKQIASFLRMRPESLSRLKAQMKQSEKEAKTLENILVTKDLQWDYMDIKEMIEKRQNGQG